MDSTLARDEDILKAAEDWRKAGRGVAIATVIETWGSAPRPVGSNLVIDSEGNFLGSVSGGCVEGAVVTEAMDVIESGKAEDAGIRRRRRERLECRAVLRRHHPRLCREGRLGEARNPQERSTTNARSGARWCSSPIRESGEQRLVKAADVGKDPLKPHLEKRIRMAKSGTEETPQGKLFFTVHVPSPQLVITGAVHITQALAPIGEIARL